MIASKNHIRQKVFRFTRWSNKSYALFNSIGQIIHIGCLTTIIQKLITIKSVIFQGFLNRLEALEVADEEEQENALVFHDIAESIGCAAIISTPSCNTTCDVSGSEVSVLYNYKKIIKAYFGPFFMAKKSSPRSGVMPANRQVMDFYAFFRPNI